MSKIIRHSETKEIEYFLNNNEKLSQDLKTIIREELTKKGERFKNALIWLIERNEAITIDVFDIKGDIIETKNFYYKDYSL